MYQGSLNFIIYFYFPILKELITYIRYCLISISTRLLVVKCYSSLVVNGFSRNEFNSCILFNFCCCLLHQKAVTHSRVTDGRPSTASTFAAITVITLVMSKTAIKDGEKENYIKKQERKRDGQNARKKECKPERRE